MTVAAPVSQALLAAIFTAGAVHKFRAPREAALAMQRFIGLTRTDIGWRWGWVLATAEALIAAALLASLFASPIRPLAAVSVFTALVAFSVLLLSNLVRGRRFPCNCFGSTHDITYLTLLRTGALALVAGWLLTGAGSWEASTANGFLATLTALAATGAAIVTVNLLGVVGAWGNGSTDIGTSEQGGVPL